MNALRLNFLAMNNSTVADLDSAVLAADTAADH